MQEKAQYSLTIILCLIYNQLRITIPSRLKHETPAFLRKNPKKYVLMTDTEREKYNKEVLMN